MDRPGELIRRATQKQGRISMPRAARREARGIQEEILPPMPPPVSRHGSYTALMRSHDRVHTRHIKG